MDLASRGEHETKLADALDGVAKQHRAELVSMLKRSPNKELGSTYWDAVEADQRKELSALLVLLFAESAMLHGSSQAAAVTKASEWAAVRATAVAAKSAEWSQSMLATAQAGWKGGEVTPDKINEVADKVFGSGRTKSTAITEVSNGVTDASEWAVSEAGLASPDDIWWTEADSRVCDTCGPLHGTKRAVWEREFPTGGPAHPGCRCRVWYANLEGVAV